MDNVRQYSLPVGFYKVNCYLVADADGNAAVIDPGDDGEGILSLARTYGLTIRTVLLTHAHWDHVGAVDVAAATGSPVLLHRDDLPMLEEWAPGPVEEKRFLEHGETVRVGGLSFDVIHTPGHTPGGLCFRVNGRLFSGDTLFAGSVGRWDFPGGSREDLVCSLRDRLMVLSDDMTVHPGHGPASTIGAERQSNPFIASLGSEPK